MPLHLTQMALLWILDPTHHLPAFLLSLQNPSLLLRRTSSKSRPCCYHSAFPLSIISHLLYGDRGGPCQSIVESGLMSLSWVATGECLSFGVVNRRWVWTNTGVVGSDRGASFLVHGSSTKLLHADSCSGWAPTSLLPRYH